MNNCFEYNIIVKIILSCYHACLLRAHGRISFSDNLLFNPGLYYMVFYLIPTTVTASCVVFFFFLYNMIMCYKMKSCSVRFLNPFDTLAFLHFKGTLQCTSQDKKKVENTECVTFVYLHFTKYKYGTHACSFSSLSQCGLVTFR